MSHSEPQVPKPIGPAAQHPMGFMAAVFAALLRQPIVLPEASVGVPAGSFEQTFMQFALSEYWAFTPVQFAVMFVQYVSHWAVVPVGPPVLPPAPGVPAV